MDKNKKKQYLILGTIVIILIIVIISATNSISVLSSVSGEESINIKKADLSCTSYNNYEINGNSMEPLLKNRSEVSVIENFEECNEIPRDSVAILTNAGSSNPLIKSIKAVPGDSFELKRVSGGYSIVINGEEIKNSAGDIYRVSGKRYDMLSIYERDYNKTIPENAYLVLSDSGQGEDSARFGLIDKENIIGIVSGINN